MGSPRHGQGSGGRSFADGVIRSIQIVKESYEVVADMRFYFVFFSSHSSFSFYSSSPFPLIS